MGIFLLFFVVMIAIKDGNKRDKEDAIVVTLLRAPPLLSAQTKDCRGKIKPNQVEGF
jgi:hypothetical protein